MNYRKLKEKKKYIAPAIAYLVRNLIFPPKKGLRKYGSSLQRFSKPTTGMPKNRTKMQDSERSMSGFSRNLIFYPVFLGI